MIRNIPIELSSSLIKVCKKKKKKKGNSLKVHLHYSKLDRAVKNLWGSFLRDKTKNAYLNEDLIRNSFCCGLMWDGYSVSNLPTSLIALKHVWGKVNGHVWNVSEYNKEKKKKKKRRKIHPRLDYFCTAKPSRPESHHQIKRARKTSRKQSSTQTNSPANKIVWRTEWAALGWWKSIKSGGPLGVWEGVSAVPSW